LKRPALPDLEPVEVEALADSGAVPLQESCRFRRCAGDGRPSAHRGDSDGGHGSRGRAEDAHALV